MIVAKQLLNQHHGHGEDGVAKFDLRQLLDMTDFKEVIQLLGDANVRMELVVQKPGYAVYTPPGQCSAHFVVWLGEYGEHMAWNYSTTDQGFLDCERVWSDYQHQDGNSGLDTQRNISKLWLQHQAGRQMGMDKEMEVMERLMIYCKNNGIAYEWWKGASADWNCKQKGCVHHKGGEGEPNWPVRDLYVAGRCWKCFAKEKQIRV
jgi:hypothetical protein